MSLSRFFLPPQAWTEERRLTLSGDEAHHCARVLRRQPGDHVEIFDGAGHVAQCRIDRVGKEAVTTWIESATVHPPLPHRIHLLPALIKSDAFDWLLEKAVELGAASIRPVLTVHTVVPWKPDTAEKKMTRWRRHMLEAAKQCHTPFLPALHEPVAFAEAFRDLPDDTLRLLPALSEQSRQLHAVVRAEPAHRTACVLIGPEGDFSPDEERLAQTHGFQPVTLGPLILRAETAALTTLAVLSQTWG